MTLGDGTAQQEPANVAGLESASGAGIIAVETQFEALDAGTAEVIGRVGNQARFSRVERFNPVGAGAHRVGVERRILKLADGNGGEEVLREDADRCAAREKGRRSLAEVDDEG